MSERRGRRKLERAWSSPSAGHPDPDASQLLQSLTRFPLNLNFNSCSFFINRACTPPRTFDPHLARRRSRGRTPTRSYSPYDRNRSSSRSSNSHHHRRRRRRSNSHHRRMRRSSSSSYSSDSDSSDLDSSNSDSSNSDIVREPIPYSRSPSPYRSPVRDDSLDDHYSRSPNHSLPQNVSPLITARSRSRSRSTRTPAGSPLVHFRERSLTPTRRS